MSNASKTTVPQINGYPVFRIRLSPELKNQLKKASEKDGYKSLGTWMKALAKQRIKEQTQ